MHFALPPRKTSYPPPYARYRSRPPLLRRNRLRLIAVLGCGALALLLLSFRLFRSSSDRPPPGTPPVVIVTPVDEELFGHRYISRIKKNREEYAARHGYKTFFPTVKDYDLKGASAGWSRVPAIRHAMALNPHSTYFFHLDQRALVMNTSLSVEAYIMAPRRLESLMLKDIPVVPPDSVIKTFSHLRGDQVDLVLTQDDQGLGPGSIVVKQGEWAKFFLDSWFDPIYRSYNFQKAETHALEHIVQWHPTILARLALIPQRIMNAYNTDDASDPTHVGDDCLFNQGDFIIHFSGCGTGKVRRCEDELEPYYIAWEESLGRS
ncbi:MAG: hypothetical protein M1816_002339 [Peltula sp. TS41687]|nr:MAG: hypothetical protein M1816_002339 [Peltula sp. TS41687]